MRRSLILLAVAAFISAQDTARSPRQFWNGFERGFSQARSEVQRTVQDNLMTALGRVESLGHKIGALSKSTEEAEVPLERKKYTVTDVIESEPYEGLGIGLRVPYEEEAEPIPERIPTRNPSQGSSNSRPVRPNLFDFNFGFNSRFPFTVYRPDRYPTIFNRRSGSQPWWKGENVCISIAEENEATDELEQPAMEAEVGDGPIEDGELDQGTISRDGEQEEGRGFFFGHMTVHSCSEQRDKYTCTTKVNRQGVLSVTSKTYRCCHGYVREDNGCVKVDTLPLTESLEVLGLKNFLSLATTSQTLGEVEGSNLTIFAPTDEALLTYMSASEAERNDLDSLDGRYPATLNDAEIPEMRERMKLHLHSDILYSSDFVDEQVIPSLSSQSGLRLNIYPQSSPPLLTVNCAPIVDTDNHFAEGVIHTVDRVIEPATMTIAQLIQNDPQFSNLKQLLTNGGLMETLSEDGQFTLLAPIDEAFQQTEDLDTLLSSSACSPAIARNHILPNVICAAAMTASPEARTQTLLGNYLHVSYQVEGNILVGKEGEEAQVVKKDIVATNGVIQVIDKVIIPKEGSPASTMLQNLNLTRFLDLVKRAGLEKEIDTSNVTVMAPTNEAIEGYPGIEDIQNNIEELKALLSYHIVKKAFDHEDSYNNQMLDTVSGVPMRINYFRGPPIMIIRDIFRGPSALMRVTASCSPLSRLETRACGGTRIRVVDQVLEPAGDTVMDRLRSIPDLSIFLSLVEDYADKEIFEGPGPLTILAPSDHVFRTLPEEELREIREDPFIRQELLERHVIKEFLCCSGISPSVFPITKEAQTLHGNPIRVHRTQGRLMAGPARITKCNSPSVNGLVHVVDKLFVEPHVPEVRFNWNRDSPMILRIPLFN